jgi:4-hydroxybenzoate polyprenyltransferase
MKTMRHFLRLIRFSNLLVIVLTMCVVQLFLRNAHIFQNTNFVLLIVSTVLIAAAGNIINDYFDVKADRINKPNRLIIGKYIKRRWAMVLHWSFNTVGMLIALYVGYKLQNVWIPLIAFLAINLLWFYSAYYKRRPIIGNIIVASLLGVLPVYILLFNMPIHNVVDVTKGQLIYDRYFIDTVVLVSVLAFLLNLNREIIKDIQDVRGDLRLGAQTLPIRYGVKKTKIGMALLVVVTVFIYVFYFYKIQKWDMFIGYYGESIINTYFLLLLGISFCLMILSFLIMLFSQKKKGYSLASILLKFAMLFGLLTPLFL